MAALELRWACRLRRCSRPVTRAGFDVELLSEHEVDPPASLVNLRQEVAWASWSAPRATA
jgi:hypothetical protein